MTRTIVVDAEQGWTDETTREVREAAREVIANLSTQSEVDVADELYPVPEATDFVDPHDPERELDYLPARDLESIGAYLIQCNPDLFHSHDDYTIRYLWRRQGGAVNGANVLGKCVKATGMMRYWADADYVIWLAADHLRATRVGREEVEAALFHELHHIEIDAETGKPGIRAHDFEGFLEELLRYGLWRLPLQRVGEAVQQLQQLSMFGQDGAK